MLFPMFLFITIYAAFFAERRMERERLQRESQEHWLRRIGTQDPIPPDSP
jgi:hypothetical protein